MSKPGASGKTVQRGASPAAAVTNPLTEAMAVGTGVVAGAIQARGEIVAATADMAKSAARTVSAVTTAT